MRSNMPSKLSHHFNHFKMGTKMPSKTLALFALSLASISMLASANSAEPNSINDIDTQNCPNVFYQVDLPEDGKLCQVFAADFPASMIFFVPQAPADVLAYYQAKEKLFSVTKQIKDRVMLQSADKNTTLIISSDGNGTQVDVLVKSEQS